MICDCFIEHKIILKIVLSNHKSTIINKNVLNICNGNFSYKINSYHRFLFIIRHYYKKVDIFRVISAGYQYEYV